MSVDRYVSGVLISMKTDVTNEVTLYLIFLCNYPKQISFIDTELPNSLWKDWTKGLIEFY